jgi:SAM-dependent methyltransferase
VSEPPVRKASDSESEGETALDVEIVEEVTLPVVQPLQSRSSDPPRPPRRSSPPRPVPRCDIVSGPIEAMPIISLGPPSREGDTSVEVASSGVTRSSVLPPSPKLTEIEEEVTPARGYTPLTKENGSRSPAHARRSADETEDDEDELEVEVASDPEPASPPVVSEPITLPRVVALQDRRVLAETHPPPFVSVQEPPPPAPPAEEIPNDRLSEPPPEVDPEDVEIHEIASHLQFAPQSQSRQPPPRMALPLPLYARGAELAAAVQAQQTAESAGAKRGHYWWDEMFGDDFLRTMDRLTQSQVTTEVSFIEESLAVQKGGIILDLACGAGRHAVELAIRGYNVVGYDLSLAMLARAADEAQERDQKLNFLHGDMRDMGFEEMFDGVFCWSTSFGYFDDEKNQLVAQKIHRALRKGGMLLLDVANRDFVTQRQPSLVWFEGDGCVCMDEMRVDFITSRLRVKRMVILEDGRTRELDYSIRLYTLHELGRMLHDVGFKVTEVSGHPATPGVFMGADSPRLIVLAEKG